MKRWLWIFVLVVIALGVVTGLFRSRSQFVQAQLEALPTLEGDFRRADGPRPFSFPIDHGAHLDYQTEWWYYTGNLIAEDGRLFGFQLTFFRRGLISPEKRVLRQSRWATDQVYMAHFALSHISDGRFHAFERFSRGAATLAGAEVGPFYRVWLEDWQVVQKADDEFRLYAAEDDMILDLMLKDMKGPVLQGIEGYSQKGTDPGNASYYYSQSRLLMQGKLSVEGEVLSVQGEGWMDHEFGTSALAEDQNGWDWFALQLSDWSELMVYTIRKTNGDIDPFSRGIMVFPDGSVRALELEDFSIRVTDTWKSSFTESVYPAGWIIEVPEENLVLRVKPRLADQELRLSFIYWEGSVEVNGEKAGEVIGGQGYVELTGYAQSMQGRF